MPKGGPSVVKAFEAYVGAVPGSVKMSYQGTDKFGNRVYRFTYQFQTMRGIATSTNTLAVLRDGRRYQFAQPDSAAANQPIAGQGDVTLKEGTLTPLQQRAIAKVGELLSRGVISSSEAKTLIENIPNMTDSSLTTLITRGGAFAISPAVIEGEQQATDDYSDLFSGLSLGGGGGGGGRIAPVYRKPDERVIRDFVKGTLVSLVGEVPEDLIGPAVEVFMRDHRANFDSEGEEIDPSQSVLEFVRNTEQYQEIHKLRPDSVDEREWISQRRTQSIRGGLSEENAQQFAITQATIGGDIQDIERAAAVSQFKRSGRAPALLRNEMRGAIKSVFQGVYR